MDALQKTEKESLIDLTEIFNAQSKLDDMAFKNANVIRERTETQRNIALVAEIIEVADELPVWWKYWKKGIKPINDANLLEELADVLHFIVSIGIDIGVSHEHNSIVLYKTPEKQLDGLLRWATLASGSAFNWGHLLGIYRGLIETLNIDWNIIVVAYFIKNNKNRERQLNGY